MWENERSLTLTQQKYGSPWYTKKSLELAIKTLMKKVKTKM